MSNWLYNGKEITSLDDMPSGVFGFIYEVTHIPSGKKYLGRKQLIYTRKKKIGKRETERLKQEKKENDEPNWWIVPKSKYVEKESDWKTYYGSSSDVKELLKEGTEKDFQREILDFAYHKKQLNYKETKLLYVRGVLEKDEYINSNISGKFYKKDTKDNID